mmetsp:Transcript_39886/g.79808  ORF Transcript_39886/g.79808 Transcript_39886/m.79808 type:complete len:102 (-) Transcript_39886:330-635(-)
MRDENHTPSHPRVWNTASDCVSFVNGMLNLNQPWLPRLVNVIYALTKQPIVRVRPIGEAPLINAGIVVTTAAARAAAMSLCWQNCMVCRATFCPKAIATVN